MTRSPDRTDLPSTLSMDEAARRRWDVVIAGADLSVHVGAEGADTFDRDALERVVEGFRGERPGS